MEKQYKNATLSEVLENISGPSGLKTDVSVKIAPATIPIVIGSVMIAVIAGILIAGAIQKRIKS